MVEWDGRDRMKDESRGRPPLEQSRNPYVDTGDDTFDPRIGGLEGGWCQVSID